MKEVATTNNGTWKISGVNFTPSDDFYGKVKKAIESGNVRQSFLQQVTGHFGPIVIDPASKEIYFLSC